MMIRMIIYSFEYHFVLYTGMGEFNSHDHYIYYCGQECLRRNGVDIMVNKRVQNAVLGRNLKNDRMISVCLKANHSILQLSKSMPKPQKAEVEQFYEDLLDLLG